MAFWQGTRFRECSTRPSYTTIVVILNVTERRLTSLYKGMKREHHEEVIMINSESNVAAFDYYMQLRRVRDHIQDHLSETLTA